jgi:hypothetical protein
MEQIDHKQIPVYAGKTQGGQTFTHFGEHIDLRDRSESMAPVLARPLLTST